MHRPEEGKVDDLPPLQSNKNLVAGVACACAVFGSHAKDVALKAHQDDLPHKERPIQQTRLVETANVTSAATAPFAGPFALGKLRVDSTSPHPVLTWQEPKPAPQSSDFHYGVVPLYVWREDLVAQATALSTGLPDSSTTLYWSPGQAVAPSTGLAMPTDPSSGSNPVKG